MLQATRSMSAANHGECRPISACREGAGIAMGEQTSALGKKLSTMITHGCTHPAIFVVNQDGLGFQAFEESWVSGKRIQALCHAIQCPE